LDEVLFEDASPLNYAVTLRRLTWENHEARRPEIVGHVDNVSLCIREPHIVIDTKDGRAHYYRMGHGRGKTANCYLYVLVRARDTGEHVVASVWFTPEIEEGELLWFRMP